MRRRIRKFIRDFRTLGAALGFANKISYTAMLFAALRIPVAAGEKGPAPDWSVFVNIMTPVTRPVMTFFNSTTCGTCTEAPAGMSNWKAMRVPASAIPALVMPVSMPPWVPERVAGSGATR